MTFLRDVNVWLAPASLRHAHAVRSGEWLDSAAPEGAVFGRVTQMALLRLLTNATVIDDDVLTSLDAWRAYRTILADERIGFAPEPLALEEHWRKLS
jgi:predicted nucleic acid-binding protein